MGAGERVLDMIAYENHMGQIRISPTFFARLIGNAVSSCYGVANMVPRGRQWWRSKFFSRKNFADTGIIVRGNAQSLIVDLHITVIYGLNISAISHSIVNKVTYTVEDATGIKVDKVYVHVDRMIAE